MNPLWKNLDAFEQICFVVNGQILKNNLTIWSHWSSAKKLTTHWSSPEWENYKTFPAFDLQISILWDTFFVGFEAVQASLLQQLQ